ncbi:retrovirus-related pol polyprotein from transposon TNT 1-94 [Tanacetum coccineum]|uniref:Retrovirus-related pol polyprotein from transposon TNT 1-94 n=1 Tax=Tanacetum coccineum TaxID=301880 RepID=A0ABQ5BGH3_9ASTR
MKEYHKLLTDQVYDAILRYNFSKPLPLGGDPGHVTIQPDFFFNKDLEYLRYDRKMGRPALSISKMKAAYYPDVGLEQMVPDQMWIEEECKYDVAAMYGISHWWFQRQRFYIDRHTSEGDRRAVRTHMRILSVIRIEVFPMYGYNYMKKIVLRRADLKEYVIAERDFKYLYPSDFEDLNLVIRQRVEDIQLGIESYQTQLNHTKPRWDAKGFEYKHDFTVIDSPRAVTFRDKYGVQMIMRFNEIHKFSDGTLQQINEALDYRVKEFRVNRMNPGLDTRFWTKKDVDRSKEFMLATQKRLKIRRLHKDGDADASFHYLLGYSLVSKALKVFNTRRQQTEETYHITFGESPDVIKFSKPSVDNINIAENKRYQPDEYLHPYEPSQRYQTNNNDVSFIEPYESPEPVVHETKISEHLSSPNVEDTLVQDKISIPNPPLPIPSVVTPALQDRWSQDKHIELVNIIRNPGAGMLTRAMAKQLSVASAHESQGYNQQEGIDYDETFAPFARLEEIRIFLAFATYMNFIVYQMDVKSTFLNGKLKEEVYVKQPLGFESNEFPNHVCKLDKALYGLKQAPRA